MDPTETWARKLAESNRRSPRRTRMNLLGRRFGRLVVVAYSHTLEGVWWRCECDCGKTHITKATRLKKGETRSCGCLKLESQRAQCAAMREREIEQARLRREGGGPCALAEALGYRTR